MALIEIDGLPGFTWVYLLKMGGSFYGHVSHNQMVNDTQGNHR